MEYAQINRDQSLTVEQQLVLLTQRIAMLEQVVKEMQEPVTWQVIESAGQLV